MHHGLLQCSCHQLGRLLAASGRQARACSLHHHLAAQHQQQRRQRRCERQLAPADEQQPSAAVMRAARRPLASVPDDALEQAKGAMQLLGSSLQPMLRQAVQEMPVGTDQQVALVMARTKAKRGKKQQPLDEEAQAAIRARIAASMARRAAKPRHQCPACGVVTSRQGGIVAHIDRCCPDLVPPEQRAAAVAEGSGPEVLQALLAAAAAEENKRRRQALEITFLSGHEQTQQPQAAAAGQRSHDGEPGLASDGDDDGDGGAGMTDAGGAFEGGYSSRSSQRILEGPAEIAAALGVPLARAERLLRQAMRCIPMAVDSTTPLDVVHEDGDFVAVNKPVGFHTAPIHRWQGGSVVSILLAHFARTAAAAAAADSGGDGGGDADGSVPAAGGADGGASAELQPQQQPRHVAAAKPYVMHRLDFNTSGLLLFGKRREVVPGVAAQFRQRQVTKSYLAITVGVPQPPPQQQQPGSASHEAAAAGAGGFRRFLVDAPLDDHPEVAMARCVAAGGKAASTEVEVLSVNPSVDLRSLATPGHLFHERGGQPGSAARDRLTGVALVRCFPKTGRTHQIRVHMAHLGHPLLGDELYGVTGPWIGRQALHARSLALRHPLTGEALEFVAPLHDDFRDALRQLGLALPDGGAG